MRVGDTVIRVPETFADYDFKSRKSIKGPLKGKVIYVHPNGRYHTVEFMTRGGPIRESFLGVK